MSLRREFDLPPEDVAFLTDYGLDWETIIDGSPWVLIHDFPTHQGYTLFTTTAAIRIETGYPPAALDMVYFHPALVRKDGKAIGATQAIQNLDGNSFQRWSRHRSGKHPWNPKVDNLGTHITLVEEWVAREFES